METRKVESIVSLHEFRNKLMSDVEKSLANPVLLAKITERYYKILFEIRDHRFLVPVDYERKTDIYASTKQDRVWAFVLSGSEVTYAVRPA